MSILKPQSLFKEVMFRATVGLTWARPYSLAPVQSCPMCPLVCRCGPQMWHSLAVGLSLVYN